jgi:adenylyltransferase/sulfurtransferase
MKVLIPTPLRQYAGNRDAVEVAATTVAEALKGLVAAHPQLGAHLYGPDGKLRAFVDVFLNDEEVRHLRDREATPVADGDTLTIVPSIAGGAGGGISRRRRSPRPRSGPRSGTPPRARR